MIEPIGIAGAGRVAQAVGRLLLDRGFAVTCIASRDIEHSLSAATFIGGSVRAVAYRDLANHAGRILVAVPDGALTAVADEISLAGLQGGIVLHTCGSRGAEALRPLTDLGASCGTLHPLQTIANPEQGFRDLPGCAFAVDGGVLAIEWAEEIAAAFGGEVLRIPQELRPIYHAGAVMASNYLCGLVEAARQLLEMAGVGSEASMRALIPLLRTSMNNIMERGPVEALTGPIERGDTETVKAHLEALQPVPGPLGPLYRAAGLQVLSMARVRGLSSNKAASIETELQGD